MNRLFFTPQQVGLSKVDAAKETSITKEKNRTTTKETSLKSIKESTQNLKKEESKKALEKKLIDEEEIAKQEAAKEEKELWLNLKFKQLETNLKSIISCSVYSKIHTLS